MEDLTDDVSQVQDTMFETVMGIRPIYTVTVFSLASRNRGPLSLQKAMDCVVALGRAGKVILCCPPKADVGPMTLVMPKLLRIGAATPEMADLLYGPPDRTWSDAGAEHRLYPLPGSAAREIAYELTFDACGVLDDERVVARTT